jgi:adenylate cyclase
MREPTVGPHNSVASLKLCLSIALVWAVIGVTISMLTPWQMIELRVFDRLTVATAEHASKFPITVVGIDEESFAKLQLQWPWPRRVHAELINRLSAAGAAVIVFDIVFSEPSNPEDDLLMANAIGQAGNVVLAADRIYRESSNVRQWVRLDPLPAFIDAGAHVGLATVALDRDLILRQMPDSADALWRAAIVRLLAKHPQVTPDLSQHQGARIRYVGPDHTFPYVSYHEILSPTGSIPDDFFKDQIVIIGRDVKASPDVESAQADLFATPFLASTGWLMPGAEVHANIMETALGGKAIRQVPQAISAMLILLVTMICAISMRRWHPLRSAAYGLAIGVALTASGWLGFWRWNLWVPLLTPLAAIPLMYLSFGGYAYALEYVRRKDITRIFSLYVTPQVVDYLIAHPEAIRLGGARKNLTIMFTDLQGFTSLSEKLSPERVTELLNQYFTEMTDIILNHDGTVCTFIGDAIMAFWGAPLDDDSQALHATSTAIAMQRAMRAFRASIERQGMPPLYMRVGIHSGHAVVGNLGSAKRFDYTAIGDDVNLAARLEGVNKLYGTEILISETTAEQIRGQVSLRWIDRVVVKGKSQPINIYTPCDDQTLIEKSSLAITQYQSRNWADAKRYFRELMDSYPEDPIAPVYLKRLEDIAHFPPPEGWHGGTELDKL